MPREIIETTQDNVYPSYKISPFLAVLLTFSIILNIALIILMFYEVLRCKH